MDDHRDPNSQLKAIEPTASCDLRIAGKISTTKKQSRFQRETRWKSINGKDYSHDNFVVGIYCIIILPHIVIFRDIPLPTCYPHPARPTSSDPLRGSLTN